MKPILTLIVIASLAAVFAMWCYVVKKELRHKMDMVKSAESQWNAYRETLLQVEGTAEVEVAEEVAKRCWDIYVQAVDLYNETLNRPINRIPALILQYRPIKLG